MRSLLIASVVSVVAYFGAHSAASISLPPARVVDALADTSTLAVGTVQFPPSALGSDPDVDEHRTLDRATSTSVPPTSTTTSTTPTIPETTVATPTTPTTIPTAGVETTVATSTSIPASVAEATTTTLATTTAPAPTARERGERALASYSYDWEQGLPGWEISFHPGRRGVLGYTFVQEKRIEVYVRSEMSDPLLAHVIAHEIGHAIDVTKNSGDDRRRWQKLRGIEDRPWWPGSGATDFSTGAGDFAESFAAWQVGSAAFRSNLGPPPDSAATALMAELANQ